MIARLTGWLARLPRAALALLSVLALGAIVGGIYGGYRSYDYVQHDNDFCLSCHLMAEPYERFAESEHRGLGCKACHRPTLLGRSQMALTQVIENPQEISVHTEVPNETCSECHVEGDPERWRSIANTVGHRVHLESDDPALQGLTCVECHASSLHEFAPIDQTCAQSGCHEDNRILLGGMSDLTIHCAACHEFVAPAPTSSSLRASTLLPDRDQCLSCHVMRTLVELPAPDPHSGVCASCHNPHEQEVPEDAVLSCTNAGCHEAPELITTFHVGLDVDLAGNCLTCHAAHDFELDGGACASCHDGGRAPDPSPDVHDDHPNLTCATCHDGSESHGSLAISGEEDCRTCHHTAPVSARCARCHDAADAPAEPRGVVRTLELSVGDETGRTLTFDHARHADLDCSSCHTDGLRMSASAVDCAGCHEEHHDPETDCRACHTRPPVSAHPPSEGHVTCSGASCHQSVPFESVPRTRQVCLACHQDLADHEPERRCNDCHVLPPPRGGDRP